MTRHPAGLPQQIASPGMYADFSRLHAGHAATSRPTRITCPRSRKSSLALSSHYALSKKARPPRPRLQPFRDARFPPEWRAHSALNFPNAIRYRHGTPPPVPAAAHRARRSHHLLFLQGRYGRTMARCRTSPCCWPRRQNATVPVLMIDWDMEAPGLHHYFGQHEAAPRRAGVFRSLPRAAQACSSAAPSRRRRARWRARCSTRSTGSRTWCGSTRAARCT